MNSVLISVLYHFGEIGVNLFILISGYFLSETKFKWKKLLLLALQTEFYIFLSGIVLLAAKQNFHFTVRHFLFPLLVPKYWFVTVYALLYVCSPYIKRLTQNLTKQEFARLLLIQIFIWSVFPTLFFFFTKKGMPEHMSYYNRYVWLFVVYLGGAYIRKFGVPLIATVKRSVAGLATLFAILVLYIVLARRGLIFWRTDFCLFWQPNSVLCAAISVLLFCLFDAMPAFYSKAVNFVASCTLGIYMLHDGLLASFLWKTVCNAARFSYSRRLLPYIALCSVCVFMCGIAVDSIRKILERPVLILLNKAESVCARRVPPVPEEKICKD